MVFTFYNVFILIHKELCTNFNIINYDVCDMLRILICFWEIRWICFWPTKKVVYIVPEKKTYKRRWIIQCDLCRPKKNIKRYFSDQGHLCCWQKKGPVFSPEKQETYVWHSRPLKKKNSIKIREEKKNMDHPIPILLTTRLHLFCCIFFVISRCLMTYIILKLLTTRPNTFQVRNNCPILSYRLNGTNCPNWTSISVFRDFDPLCYSHITFLYI